MTGLKFKGGQQEKLFSPELNNMAKGNSIGVLNGCEIEITGGTLKVKAGQLFFGKELVEVEEQTGIEYNIYGGVNARTDLLLISNTGVVSYIQGTLSILGIPPEYDSTNYYCVGLLIWNTTSTNITSSLKDIRVLNIGGAGSGGSTFGRKVLDFTNETSILVTHNLGDEQPIIQVYDSNNELIEPDRVTSVDANSVNIHFSALTSGRVIVIGGVGMNNGYHKTTFENEISVTVNHKLGNKEVLIQVLDVNGYDIIPTDIQRIDEESAIVTFGLVESGSIICVGGVSSSGTKLPVIVEGDAGKVVKINVTEDGYEYGESLPDGNQGDFIVKGTNDWETMNRNQIYSPMVPIGCILPWDKNLVGGVEHSFNTLTASGLSEGSHDLLNKTGQDFINLGFTVGNSINISFLVTGDNQEVSLSGSLVINGVTLVNCDLDEDANDYNIVYNYNGVWDASTTFKLFGESDPGGSYTGYSTYQDVVFKSATGILPYNNFVECNGQVLDDIESPFNGKTIRNLNGDARIIYGGGTSGINRTEDYLPNHNHSYTYKTSGSSGVHGTTQYSNTGSKTSGTPFQAISMTWIMRVK